MFNHDPGDACPCYSCKDPLDAEAWCDRCKRRHNVVWFAPSDLWNAVMRNGDRGKSDKYGFCCPLCFMQLAEELFGPMVFEVRRENYANHCA